MRSVRQIIRIIRLYVNTIISSIDPIIDLNQRGFPYHRIFESHYFVIFPEFQKLNSFLKYSVVNLFYSGEVMRSFVLAL